MELGYDELEGSGVGPGFLLLRFGVISVQH